jgi:hypothetical protein
LVFLRQPQARGELEMRAFFVSQPTMFENAIKMGENQPGENGSFNS